MGSACTDEPDAAGVLECLLSDASGSDQTFEDFCGEFVYDDDSRKAKRIWKARQKTAKELERLLGDDFETFMYAERD